MIAFDSLQGFSQRGLVLQYPTAISFEGIPVVTPKPMHRGLWNTPIKQYSREV
jgi:hypothetical protein